MRIKCLIFSLFLILLTLNVCAQSGGNFEITQSVIASGGGQQTTGGVFSLDSTTGQSLAGANSAGGIFGVRGGFWASPLAPSAAMVSISGRVRTAQGNGIRSVIVILTGPNGTIRSTQTATFGSFRFENVEVGGTYLISVTSKRYAFDQPTQIRTVQEEIADLEFIANDL
jgi:Carboxypeptidase regulatory-like domain